MELRARDHSSSSSALPANQGGIIRMNGFDGTDFEEMAFIGYQAEATVADGDAPSRLIFGTTSDGSGATTEKMRLTSAGRLGLGTTSPAGELHVVGATGGQGHIYVSDADNGTAGGDSLLITKSGTVGYIYNRDNGSMRFGANNNASYMVIQTDGDVGIGTTNPSFKLDVAGNARASYFALRSNESTPSETAFIYRPATGILAFGTGNTERGRFDSSGNFGIGTTSPADKLDVYGTVRMQANGLGDKHLFLVDANDTAKSSNVYFDNGVMSIESNNGTGTGSISFKGRGSTITVEYGRFETNGDLTLLHDLDVTGAVSKGSGSFKIDHPLKPETHHLIHSFIEGPQADNLYSGEIELINGQAQINLDEWFGMTEGTLVALNRDFRVFTTNESGWDNVKGRIENNILTIICQNPESNATVSWLVIGERQDKEIYESILTDDNGKIIVEPQKELENE